MKGQKAQRMPFNFYLKQSYILASCNLSLHAEIDEAQAFLNNSLKDEFGIF